MNAILLPTFQVFVTHGYLQLASADFHRYENLRYHVSIFIHDMPVNDSIIYGYSWNLRIAEPGEWYRSQKTELTSSNEESDLNVAIVK